MELQLEEASCWEYRGEGAANIVLSYTGSTSSLVGSVLRIRKSLRLKKSKSLAADVITSPAVPAFEPTTISPREDTSLHSGGERHQIATEVSGSEAAESPDKHVEAGRERQNSEKLEALRNATGETGEQRGDGIPDSAANSALPPVLSPEEQFVWSDWPELAKAASEADLVHLFGVRVMQPLLGEFFVDPGVPVDLSQQFVEDVAKAIEGKRPPWRSAGGALKLIRGRALLISDHTIFPYLPPVRSISQHPPTICVEIKPKCGFLPTAPTIAPKNWAKRQVSRFKMHQHLKLAKGEVDHISTYDPLDLFSGSPDQVLHALNCLFQTPQNNLRLFRDGQEIQISLPGLEPDKPGIPHGSDGATHLAWERALDGAFNLPPGERVGRLKHLIKSTLLGTGVLSQLLAAQKLDAYDIEGSIHTHTTLMRFLKASYLDGSSSAGPEDQGLPNQGERELAQYLATIQMLQQLPPEEGRIVVRDFLIAATAKDCGLMVALRPLADPLDSQEWGSTRVERRTTVLLEEVSGRHYETKISYVDLDLKPLKKIPKYYELDQEIVTKYKEAIGTVDGTRGNTLH